MPAGRVTHLNGAPAGGIVVANGSAVASTGEDGRFQVDGDGRFTVLTRPDGWTADPWFHAADKEHTSFVLEPAQRRSPIRFAQVTDLHLSTRPPDSRMEVPDSPEPVFEEISQMLTARQDVSLVVATGDLTDTGLDAEYEMVSKALALTSAEVVVAPGNHDHMAGEPRFFVNERGYGTNAGDPAAWEAHFGPRWFSLNRGGVHLVVIDWHMWELGLDRDIQDEWILADLAKHPAMPWVLFSHDQMPERFFERLREPLATFSGHWHTRRAVKVGSTTHINTPPLTFAGLDYSRPGAVTARWDGMSLDVERYERPLAPVNAAAITPVWTARIDSTGGLASPVAIDDRSLCGVAWDEDTGQGSVLAITFSGEERWRTQTERAVKSTPVVAGEQLVVVDVAAGVSALSTNDGSVLWRVEPVSPLRTWCWTSPLVMDDHVVVSTPTRVTAYRLADGEIAWERRDLVPHSNLLSHSTPVVAEDTLVVGFWPFTPAFFGIDVRNGETMWSIDDPEATPMEGATGRGTALAPWSPVGAGVSSGTSAVFPSAAGWAAIDVSLGEFLWRSPDEGRFRPGRPVLVDGGVLVTSPDGAKRLRAEDGTVEWSESFPQGVGVALAPYRATPHVGTAGATVAEGTVIIPGLDGSLRRLDVRDGADLGTLQAGIRSAAALLVTDEFVVVAGLDGWLAALSKDGVVP